MVINFLKDWLIVELNFIFLIGMLFFWVDFVELNFNNWIILTEMFKIIGFSFISFLIIYLFVRKKNFSRKKNYLISIVLCALISFNLYYRYSKKIYNNCLKNKNVRTELTSKIENANLLAYGSKADSLTLKEYREIVKINWFPEIQDSAYNISYTYSYDGFLPDYIFNLSYFLPLNMSIDTSKFIYGKLLIDTIDGKFKMNYNESVR